MNGWPRLALFLPTLLCLSCTGVAGTAMNEADTVQSNAAGLALAGRVTDAANVLTPAQRAALDQALAALERRTGAQMVVVTVASLEGNDITAYARDLGNRWGIGHRDRDDGVVIVAAPHERQVRIAVGLGLEQTLSDALCQKIINDKMIPAFRQGRLFEGLSKGVDALGAAL